MVQAQDRVAALLFRLARDEIPFGTIEQHLEIIDKAHPLDREGSIVYVGAAQPLGVWANGVAARLMS